MGNVLDTLLRDVGQTVWELQVTGETEGDTPLDTPSQVIKKHRVYGVFRFASTELFEQIGTSIQGEAVFFCREKLSMTSQIEHNATQYEITEEVLIDPLHTGMGYVYILHRHPGKTS